MTMKRSNWFLSLILVSGSVVVILLAGRSMAQPDGTLGDVPSVSVRPSAPVRVPSGAALDVLDLKNMDVLDVLKLISQKSGLNIIGSQNVKGRVSVYLRNIEVLDALRFIVDAYGWAYIQEGDAIKVMTVQEYETKYNRKFGQEEDVRIKEILFASVQDVVNVLNQVKTSSGKIIADEKSKTVILMDEPAKVDEMERILERIDVPTETGVFNLSYAKAEKISAKISEGLTPGVGSIRFDERSNKIIVSDTGSKIEEVRRMIEAFDQQQQGVLIESKIIQVVLSDEHKMGVDWEAVLDSYHGLDLTSNFDILTSSDKSGKVSIGTLATDRYTALVEALDTVGETNILSSPHIMVLDNEEAKILVGSTEPYVTTTTTTTSSGPTTTAESVNFIDVGVKLYVTPTIHNDGFITMKIKPEVSSVTSNLTTSNNNTIPVVETSEAETTVMVKDGITIVIGGLIKEQKIKITKKVPLLGDIPLVGGAFRSVSDSLEKTEIVIFLTARIVSGDAMKGGPSDTTVHISTK